MSDETFKTTSGKTITVHVSDEGEPVGISFEEPVGSLTENEIYDIHDYIDSLGEDGE